MLGVRCTAGCWQREAQLSTCSPQFTAEPPKAKATLDHAILGLDWAASGSWNLCRPIFGLGMTRVSFWTKAYEDSTRCFSNLISTICKRPSGYFACGSHSSFGANAQLSWVSASQPGSSHIFNERQQFPANADFKPLSFLSVGTKQQSRLKYSQSLMSICLGSARSRTEADGGRAAWRAETIII